LSNNCSIIVYLKTSEKSKRETPNDKIKADPARDTKRQISWRKAILKNHEHQHISERILIIEIPKRKNKRTKRKTTKLENAAESNNNTKRKKRKKKYDLGFSDIIIILYIFKKSWVTVALGRRSTREVACRRGPRGRPVVLHVRVLNA